MDTVIERQTRMLEQGGKLILDETEKISPEFKEQFAVPMFQMIREMAKMANCELTKHIYGLSVMTALFSLIYKPLVNIFVKLPDLALDYSKLSGLKGKELETKINELAEAAGCPTKGVVQEMEDSGPVDPENDECPHEKRSKETVH